MYDLGMILSGEIRCSSLLWVKGLNVPLRTPWSATSGKLCRKIFNSSVVILWLSRGELEMLLALRGIVKPSLCVQLCP